MTFNEKLINLRKQAGLSQDALARQLGVSRQAISKWELGTAMPETENIVKLAKIFDVKTDYLLGHSVISPPNFSIQIRKHSGTISFIIYMGLMALFLYSLMIFTVNCARGVTHFIHPFFWWTPAEYYYYTDGRYIGWRDIEYARLYLVPAILSYILMKFIRKKDEGK